jgi:hypothetical protein
LRRHPHLLSIPHRTFSPSPAHRGKLSGDHIAPGGFVRDRTATVTGNIDRRSWRLEYFEEGSADPYLIETLWSLQDIQFATALFMRMDLGDILQVTPSESV